MITITYEIVGEFKHIQVRETDELGNNHRYVISPGQDYSDKPEEVQAACEEHHTATLVAAFNAHREDSIL